MAQSDKEGITFSTPALLVRLIIKLDGANDRKIVLRAQHEIEVLTDDTIERPLAITIVHASLRLSNVGDPDLAEDPILFTNRLIQNTKEGALRRGEQNRLYGISVSFGLAIGLLQLRCNDC